MAKAKPAPAPAPLPASAPAPSPAPQPAPQPAPPSAPPAQTPAGAAVPQTSWLKDWVLPIMGAFVVVGLGYHIFFQESVSSQDTSGLAKEVSTATATAVSDKIGGKLDGITQVLESLRGSLVGSTPAQAATHAQAAAPAGAPLGELRGPGDKYVIMSGVHFDEAIRQTDLEAREKALEGVGFTHLRTYEDVQERRMNALGRPFRDEPASIKDP